SEVTGVQGMKSSLRQGDGGLIVNSLAAVDPGTDVRVAATEIDHRVKTAVHDRLGLSVERVNMEFSYREPRRGGRFPWNRRGPRHRPEAGRA
ncbi:MAG TPA: hypothetical protein VNL15_06915, partial [Dehalococcoidia bacterium]|nr:hypothetical protein [Dehalococcoidia bacterium]